MPLSAPHRDLLGLLWALPSYASVPAADAGPAATELTTEGLLLENEQGRVILAPRSEEILLQDAAWSDPLFRPHFPGPLADAWIITTLTGEPVKALAFETHATLLIGRGRRGFPLTLFSSGSSFQGLSPTTSNSDADRLADALTEAGVELARVRTRGDDGPRWDAELRWDGGTARAAPAALPGNLGREQEWLFGSALAHAFGRAIDCTSFPLEAVRTPVRHLYALDN